MQLKDIGNRVCGKFAGKCLLHSGIAVFCFLAIFATKSAAELIDRGNGLIYDSVQDLTWMQNAQVFYGSQSSVESQIENHVYMGFDDWRLPTSTQGDDPTCSPDARYTTEYEFFYEHRVYCTGGEMEMLTALYDPWNNNLFKYVDGNGRVQRYINRTRYWTATPYRDAVDPCINYPNYDVECTIEGDNGDRTNFYWQWGFTGFKDRYGPYNNLPYKTTLEQGNGRYGWAVRDGDVIPSALAGDMNLDGLVNAADYLILHQFVLGVRTGPTQDELDAGDMNNNGGFDTGDLVIHSRTVLGQI